MVHVHSGRKYDDYDNAAQTRFSLHSDKRIQQPNSSTNYSARDSQKVYKTKMLGCLNPILGQIWTNPNVG